MSRNRKRETSTKDIDIREFDTGNTVEEDRFALKDAIVRVKESFLGQLGDKKESAREQSARKMSSDEMISLPDKLKLYPRRSQIKYILLVLVLLIAGIGFGVYRYTYVCRSYTVLSSEERSDNSETRYVSLKKGCMLKCNPNGVTCVNGSGEVQWNTTFTMQNLIVDVCDSTAVVADQKGSEIYVFNEKGLVGHFSPEHLLTKVKVTRQGVVAAVLEDGDVTWVNVYDSQGNILVRNKTSMTETGYPVDMDISSDGLKMIISYLGINHNNVESRVVFYNFSSVGQDRESNLVNKVCYEGHVVPEVRFMNDNYAVAFRDDGVTIFRGTQVPEERSSITFDREIISVFSDDDYFGIVTESDEEENTHKFKLQLYRANGTRCFTDYLNMEYSDIQISKKEILLYNSNEMRIYTAGGRLKAEAVYEKPIISMSSAGGIRKYTIVTLDSTDTIKVR